MWAVEIEHDAAQRAIKRVCAIHRRGLSSVISRRLRSRVQRAAGTTLVLPKTYKVAPEGAVSIGELEQHLEERGEESAEQRGAAERMGEEEYLTRYPPAVEQEDAYNLVKFYTLERSLVWSILAATFTEKLEFPFLPGKPPTALPQLSFPFHS